MIDKLSWLFCTHNRQAVLLVHRFRIDDFKKLMVDWLVECLWHKCWRVFDLFMQSITLFEDCVPAPTVFGIWEIIWVPLHIALEIRRHGGVCQTLSLNPRFLNCHVDTDECWTEKSVVCFPEIIDDYLPDLQLLNSTYYIFILPC